jgi:hypothetical protein
MKLLWAVPNRPLITPSICSKHNYANHTSLGSYVMVEWANYLVSNWDLVRIDGGWSNWWRRALAL